jgi:hypothetical protein
MGLSVNSRVTILESRFARTLMITSSCNVSAMPSPLREHSVELPVQSCRVPAQFRSTKAGLTNRAPASASFFKHYREVEHQDGTRSMAWAEMKRTIYSLGPLRELLLAANRRYLEFISAIEDHRADTDKLNRISRDSTSSIRKTKHCSNHWAAAHSTSAAFKTKTCGAA